MKTLIDVDDDSLAAAKEVLNTTTKKDTVNAALVEVVALAARRRDLARWQSNDLGDLGDPSVMSSSWQR
jgi:Arc/MetJ family transcription regulator